MATGVLRLGFCRGLSPTAQALLAVIGGVLVHLTLGTIYTFGNMSPYVTSYIRAYSSPSDLTYQQLSWVYALALVGQGLTMFVGGAIHAKIGPILTTLLGGWTMSLGVFLTFLSLTSSFGVCVLTYGVLFGMGIGIAYAGPLSCAMKWLPTHKGLVCGIVVAGFGGGAFIFDQVQTAFINPENKTPDEQDETGAKYFSKENAGDVLSRVRPTFILLGACYAALQLIGSLMLSYPPVQTTTFNPAENQQLIVKSDSEESDSHQQEAVFKETRVAEENIVLDMHPFQVLKTRAFYTLWGIFLLNGQGIVFVSTLYKAYGQTFIADDHFLALIGAFASVCNALGRIFWGHLADRFSFRTAMLCLCVSMIALMMTLVACQYGGKPMFFIWICAIFFTFSGNFALFPTATAKTFGQKYMPINFGLVFTSQAVTGPVGVFLSTLLSESIGWFGMFCVVSGCTTLALVLTFTYNAKKPNGEDV